MSRRQLLVADTRRVVCAELRVADRFWSRLVGLQFRRSLPVGHGLLLAPCSSIHTFCMRFALDLLWLDEQRRVVEITRDVKPWRIVIPRVRAHGVVEIAAGTVDVAVGEQLAIADQ